MDGLMVGFITRELDGMLAGGRIDRITQPERDTVIIVIRAGTKTGTCCCAPPRTTPGAT